MPEIETSPDFVMRGLNPNDLSQILDFRAEVLSSLEHPDIYVPESDEISFVAAHLGERGQTFGVFCEKRLVSYGMLGLPAADDPENLGRILGLDTLQCAQVAHLASCMTLDRFRGFHIQRSLVTLRVNEAKKLGRRYCMAMVSLHNETSRSNLFAANMTIPWVGLIGTLQRQLMFIDMAHEVTFAPQRATAGSLDFGLQRKMSSEGWWGIGEECVDGVSQLVLKQALKAPDTSVKAS